MLLLSGASAGALLPKRPEAQTAMVTDLIPLNATVAAENSLVSVFVNGAPFCLDGMSEKVLFTYPVHPILRDGVNRLDFEYEPSNDVEDNFTPHSGVHVEFAISSAYAARATVLTAQYSEKEQAMVPAAVSLLTGEAPVLHNEVVTARNRFKSETTVMQFSDGVSGEYANRLTSEFQVSMPGLGDVPWSQTTVLSAESDIQKELYEAYQALHSILQAKDIAGFIELARPSLTRTARMNDYPDEKSVAERVFQLNPMGGAPGSRMIPLMNWAEFQAQPLRWGSTGQLVANFADQIQYVDEATGTRTGGMRVFFARSRNEPLRIYYSLDSGQ